MGYVAMGMQGLGGVLGAVGSIAGGHATAAADRYQAQVAQNNANVSAQAADVAQAQGITRAQPYLQQGSQRMGAARAGFGASGVDVNSGTAVAAQSSIARTTALETNAVAYDADTQAVGYRNQAANYDTQEAVDRASATNANRAGMVGALTSIIGTASGVASKWDMFKNQGVPGFTGAGSGGVSGIDGTQLAAAGGTNPWASSMLPVGA